MAPPKPAPRIVNVRVETDGTHVLITSKDGTLKLVAPAMMVTKRMHPGEQVAFFRASTQEGTDVLELEERITDEGKWW
jgi:hypothetical protein